MQTLTAALEHLAALDAKAEQPLRSSLVISQGASRLPRTGFFECVERLGVFRAVRWRGCRLLACLGSGGCSNTSTRNRRRPECFSTQGAGQLLAGPQAVSLVVVRPPARGWRWLEGQFARMANLGDVGAQSFYGHILTFRGVGLGAREEVCGCCAWRRSPAMAKRLIRSA
jgi:hypothetical protein